MITFKFFFLVPNDPSRLLRYLIETLFIVHCETQLNMICPLGADPERRYGRVYNRPWCQGLDQPSTTTTTTTASNTNMINLL